MLNADLVSAKLTNVARIMHNQSPNVGLQTGFNFKKKRAEHSVLKKFILSAFGYFFKDCVHDRTLTAMLILAN